MSGAIIFRSGGPITWKTDRQERTSLSLCEAEIRATNMGSRLTVNVRNMILHLASWLPHNLRRAAVTTIQRQ